jgi:hypothetical protein
MPDGRDGLSDEWPGESSGEARFSARLGAEWATFRPGASKPTTVGRLWSSSTLCYAPTLAPFGMHCHDVGIGPGVTNADISFTADDTLTDALVQVALIEGSRVRDIQRCDHNTWSKRLTVRCGSRSVDRVLVMVTAASAGGGYHLRVQAAQPTSDVVVMRQGHPGDGDPVGVPRGPNPPPDLRVVSDHDGALEGRVYLHQDNTLSIRLCNVGNAVARHVFVELWFQDASVQVTSDGWLPVCSRRGVIQHLAGITLEAGASRVFRVPWCPSPSGGSRHFVVCAVVRSLGDHNTEDKRALVTFRDVEVRPLG